MTKENLNYTLENTESSSTISNKLKALKKIVLSSLFLVLPIDAAIAQNNTFTDTTKAKTEIVTNEILSPEKILEKHKITDINMATIEQLELAVTDLSLALKTLVGEDRKPYLILKSHIKDKIMVKKSEEDKLMAQKILKSLQGEKK